MAVAKKLSLECYMDDYLFRSSYNGLIAQYWYALGVYTADGYVCKSGISIEVQYRDHTWVESVANLITKLTGIRYHQNVRQIKDKTYIRLRHHSTLLSQYFVSLGIPYAKTFKLRFNTKIPTAYCFPFLLGYFDGNGWVSCRERNSHMELSCGIATGSQLFADDLKGLLHDSAFPASVRKASESNSYLIEWWGTKAEKFLDTLYSPDLTSVCLLRKFIKLKNYKQRVIVRHERWWSEYDAQFLWNHQDTLSVQELATQLKRSERAIKLKLLRLRRANNGI